jgi:hypothetical protein
VNCRGRNTCPYSPIRCPPELRRRTAAVVLQPVQTPCDGSRRVREPRQRGMIDTAGVPPSFRRRGSRSGGLLRGRLVFRIFRICQREAADGFVDDPLEEERRRERRPFRVIARSRSLAARRAPGGRWPTYSPVACTPPPGRGCERTDAPARGRGAGKQKEGAGVDAAPAPCPFLYLFHMCAETPLLPESMCWLAVRARSSGSGAEKGSSSGPPSPIRRRTRALAPEVARTAA